MSGSPPWAAGRSAIVPNWQVDRSGNRQDYTTHALPDFLEYQGQNRLVARDDFRVGFNTELDPAGQFAAAERFAVNADSHQVINARMPFDRRRIGGDELDRAVERAKLLEVKRLDLRS